MVVDPGLLAVPVYKTIELSWERISQLIGPELKERCPELVGAKVNMHFIVSEGKFIVELRLMNV